jgi:hypothetical protein
MVIERLYIDNTYEIKKMIDEISTDIVNEMIAGEYLESGLKEYYYNWFFNKIEKKLNEYNKEIKNLATVE